MRDLFRAGASAVLLLVVMLGGSLVLWIVVPMGWLYIGSQIQGSTNSVGTAIVVMFAGAIVSVVVIAWVLARLNGKLIELREARGIEYTGSPLERVMVVSAALAVAAFVFWFLILQGPGPSLAPKG